MAILAPIQQHIEALANETGFPAAAVEACLARPEQAAPLLRAILQRAARGTLLSNTEKAQLFVGLPILAKLRDRQSFPPLMRLLGGPIEIVDDLLGDMITEGLSTIIASLYDGDDHDVFEMIADASVDDMIRDALWRAATTLVLAGKIERDTMRAFLLRFDAEKLAPKGDFAWIGWLGAIAHLGFEDVAANIGSVWIDQRLPDNVMERRHFDADLAAALAAPNDMARLEPGGIGLVDDVAKTLAWANWNGPPQPIVNPLRNVGRNDPCPCGSGKKAKKCCLAAA